MKQVPWDIAIYPSLLLTLTFVPLVNLFCFSLHGGLGWILMYLSGPVVLGRLCFGVFLSRKRPLSIKIAVVSWLLYVVLTYITGALSTRCLGSILGVSFHGNAVWAALNIPWSFLAGNKVFS